MAELEAIKHLLHYDWDPIGVAGIEEAIDEYDSYALRIYSMLAQGKNAEAITRYLDWVVTEHMGLPLRPDHNRAITDKVIEIYLERR